jgi:hypothetical protein
MKNPATFRLPGSVSRRKPKEGTYWQSRAFGSDPLLSLLSAKLQGLITIIAMVLMSD